MLILARRPGERIVIGGDVLVTVMEITGQTVRLGIEAAPETPVYREEIWLAVQAENMAAASSAPDALPTRPAPAAEGAGADGTGEQKAGERKGAGGSP
jgi:carbon storage regulator